MFSSSRPLNFIQIDLFWQVKSTLVNGRNYKLVIVDDYIRWHMGYANKCKLKNIWTVEINLLKNWKENDIFYDVFYPKIHTIMKLYKGKIDIFKRLSKYVQWENYL